jgi:hypothetical protein
VAYVGSLLWEFVRALNAVWRRYWILARTEPAEFQLYLPVYIAVWALPGFLWWSLLPRLWHFDTFTRQITWVLAALASLGMFFASLKIARAVGGFRAHGGWGDRYYTVKLWGGEKWQSVLRRIQEAAEPGWVVLREPMLPHAFASLTCPSINIGLLEGLRIPITNKAIRVRHLDFKTRWVLPAKRWYAYKEGYGASGHQQGALSELRNFSVARAQGLHSNDDKIRLAGNIRLIAGRFDGVEIQQTDYVSSLMTDGLAFSEVKAVPFGGLANLSDGLTSFFDQSVGLLPLAATYSSNQLGASTLAFSNDGVAIILLQTSVNQYSGNSYVPTGSGSLDWRDIECAQDANDLVSVLEYGALRELREECGIPATRLCSLKPYAFCRLIHRGGKPEFFFIARVFADFETINLWQVQHVERKFTNKFPEDKLIAERRKIDFSAGNLQDQFAALRQQIVLTAKSGGLSVSYQLLHGLMLLEEASSTEDGADLLRAWFAAQPAVSGWSARAAIAGLVA